jgi:hypothetical protein
MILNKKARKETVIKFEKKTVAIPTLTYSSETWIPMKAEAKITETTETKFLRDFEISVRNTVNRKSLNILNLNNRIQNKRLK